MTSIYHYTSGSALLGIINNSEFWATDINFLNDHQEHVLGYKAAVEYIEGLKRSEDDPNFGEWLKQLYQQLIDSSKANVIDRQTYVVSFSKRSDSVAHWFSYCEKNQGYCIEFDEGGFIAEDAESEFFFKFEDVNYADADAFSASLNGVVSRASIIERMLEGQKTAHAIGLNVRVHDNAHVDKFLMELSSDLMRSLISRLMISSCTYKDKGFAHEDEKRLVMIQKDLSSRDEFKPVGMKFREKNGAIYPYASLRFNRGSIKSIVVGPCSDYEFKKAGLLKLLKFRGIDCEVRPSGSSLRFA